MKRASDAAWLGLAGGGLLALTLTLLLVGRRDSARAPIQLKDVTSQTEIRFRHTDGSSGRRYLVEAVSAGLALFDYNQDGLIDVYLLNGAPLPGLELDTQPTNALYRNVGGFRFVDVTRQAGVGDTRFGLGVAVGDYDNDGDPDLFVNNYGPNVLYRNNGDGTFTDVTEEAGVAGGDRVGAGACFLDMDADGDLDLYVSNYIQFDYDNHVPRTIDGIPVYPGPEDFQPEADLLYRNNGNGTFADVSAESGIAEYARTGMGMVCADYDRDGDTDIFAVNEVTGNFFYENDGTGTFSEVGLAVGGAYNVDGQALGSKGVDCADYDNDGFLDFFITSYQGELPALFRNSGRGYLEDVTLTSGAGAGSFPHVNWGNGLVDFDNDGDRDLFIACGHLQDNIELYDRISTYHARNILLMNTGHGQFEDISDQCGDGLEVKLSSRGAAFDDLDNDGRIDAVVLNSRREPTILRNDSPVENHWIQIRLRGVTGNRDGIGASVEVMAGDLTQVDEVHSGRGYQSHYGTRLHFGLGPRDHVDRIEVRWIGVRTDVVQDLEADRLVTITEGAGRAE